MEANKSVFLVMNNSDSINFKSYIDAVKEKKITWDLFIQLMQDLSTNMNRQKLLISILLQEFKTFINTNQCLQCQSKGKSENFQCIPTTIEDSMIQKSNFQDYESGIIIRGKNEEKYNFEDNPINESIIEGSANLESTLIIEENLSFENFTKPLENDIREEEIKNLPSNSCNLALEKMIKSEPNDGIDFELTPNDGSNIELTDSNLVSNRLRQGPPKKIHQCRLCMKILKNPRHLLVHIKSVHEGRKDEECHICDKKFARRNDLNKHITRHKKVQNYVCDKCARGYAFRYELTNHINKNLCEIEKQKSSVVEEAYQRCENISMGIQQKSNPDEETYQRIQESEDKLSKINTNLDNSNTTEPFTNEQEEEGDGYQNENENEHSSNNADDGNNLESKEEKQIKCDPCKQEFTASRYYIAHFKAIHGGGMPPGYEKSMQFSCDQCHRTFSLNMTLKRHIQIKHPTTINRNLDCNNDAFANADSKVSNRLRQGPPKKNHQCRLCMKTHNSPSDLLVHIKSVHERRKDENCHICDKKFARKNDLRKHIMRHERIKNFVCELCGKGYPFKHELTMHINSKMCSNEKEKLDTIEEAYNRCGNSISIMQEKDKFNTNEEIEIEGEGLQIENLSDFTVSSTSLDHLEKFEYKSQQEGTSSLQSNDIGNLEKQPSKKLMCAKCPQEFAAPHYYIAHYKSHGGGNELPPGFENFMQFKCDQCPKSFSKTSSLKRHTQLKHLSESEEIDQNLVSKRLRQGPPTRIHQCKLCLKTFKSPYILVDHIKRDHEGRKDHNCHICGKEFGRRTVLQKHIKRHKKIKDFVCETCGKAFKFKSDLNYHVKKKHLLS